MSCAPSPSSDFLPLAPLLFFSSFFFLSSFLLSPIIPQTATTVSLILGRTHFTRNKRIALSTDLVIYALCGSSHPFPAYLLLFICFHQRLHAHDDDLTISAASIASSYIFFFFFLLPARWISTLLFHTLDAISCCLESQLSIISIVAGKPQSALVLLLIFFLLVTLKAHSDTEGAEITGCRAPLCVPVIGAHRSSMKLAVD